MRPQFIASLTDDSKGGIYNCNMFIIQATGGSAGLRCILQLLCRKKAHNLTSNEAEDKISTNLNSSDLN